MNKEILNKNDKNQWHGYQEWYYNNKLFYRGKWKNNRPISYFEDHVIKRTHFHIK